MCATGNPFELLHEQIDITQGLRCRAPLIQHSNLDTPSHGTLYIGAGGWQIRKPRFKLLLRGPDNSSHSGIFEGNIAHIQAAESFGLWLGETVRDRILRMALVAIALSSI